MKDKLQLLAVGFISGTIFVVLIYLVANLFN